MALLLALLALIVAGLAVLAAWRSHRSAHRLALEMVQLRDRLARAEAARAAAVARAAEQPALAVDDEGTRERLAHLEAALADALGREAATVAASDDEHDRREAVTRHLVRQGYERVTILDVTDDGAFLVEALRRGAITKGRAEIAADGTVRLRTVSSLRAFP